MAKGSKVKIDELDDFILKNKDFLDESFKDLSKVFHDINHKLKNINSLNNFDIFSINTTLLGTFLCNSMGMLIFHLVDKKDHREIINDFMDLCKENISIFMDELSQINEKPN